jgi:hypothetical protein
VVAGRVFFAEVVAGWVPNDGGVAGRVVGAAEVAGRVAGATGVAGRVVCPTILAGVVAGVAGGAGHAAWITPDVAGRSSMARTLVLVWMLKLKCNKKLFLQGHYHN